MPKFLGHRRTKELCPCPNLESPSPIPLLPPELWCRIAEYIEDEELGKLIGLNRLFNQLAGDRRYHEIALVATPSQFLKEMEAFQSSELAARVKVLRVAPGATWAAIQAAPSITPITGPDLPLVLEINKPSRSKSKSILRSMMGLIKKSKSQFRVVPTPITPPLPLPKLLPSLSSEEKVQAITSIAETFLNVKRLTVTWEHGQVHIDCPFLSSFLHTFSNNLVVLRLNIPVSIFQKFQFTSYSFASLEELDIIATWPYWHDSDSFGAHTPVVEPLVLFINNLPDSLQSLFIDTMGAGYVFAYFKALKTRPALKHLSLVLPYWVTRRSLGPLSPNLPDMSDLSRLLCGQPLLETLTIRFQPHFPGNPATWHASEQYMQCFQGVAFKNLQSLRLGLGYPFDIASGHFDGLIPIMRGVKSFTISDTRLSLSEITRVLLNRPLCISLETLSLYVREIDSELFRLLARRLPNLKCLILDYDKTIDADQLGTDIREDRKYDALLYDSWVLGNIEIWTWEYKVGLTLQFDLMRAVADNVPAITSFAGQPFIRVDGTPLA